MELRWLISWLWNKEIILNYLDEPRVIPELKCGRESQSNGNVRRTQPDTAGFEDGKEL